MPVYYLSGMLFALLGLALTPVARSYTKCKAAKKRHEERETTKKYISN